jgi:hypothetical protein
MPVGDLHDHDSSVAREARFDRPDGRTGAGDERGAALANGQGIDKIWYVLDSGGKAIAKAARTADTGNTGNTGNNGGYGY